MKDRTHTVLQVYFDAKDERWHFRTIAGNFLVGDVSEGYIGKTVCVRDAKRWHPGVPLEIIDKGVQP